MELKGPFRLAGSITFTDCLYIKSRGIAFWEDDFEAEGFDRMSDEAVTGWEMTVERSLDQDNWVVGWYRTETIKHTVALDKGFLPWKPFLALALDPLQLRRILNARDPRGRQRIELPDPFIYLELAT